MSFGKALEAASRQIRPFFLPSHRRAFTAMLARGLTEQRPGEPLIVCDLADVAIDAVGGRYYASMVRDFIDAGYFPVFTARRATVSSFVTSKKKSLLLGERMGVVKSLADLRQPYFLVTDRPEPPPALAEKVVRVDYAPRLSRGAGEMELPFFVHPQIAKKVKLPHPYAVEATRPVRIFFGGNTSDGRYDKDAIRDIYRMLTRREMLATATAAAAGRIEKPTDAAAWLASDAAQDFVMFETQRTKIPGERWIDALAKADFFLACPGVGMPLCHNLIETMAAGAVPILQYAAYLPVPLRDGIDCLGFRSADELAGVVARVLAMSPEEVRPLRAGVRAYYEAHLAPGCFTRALFGGDASRKTLLFNAYRVAR